MSQIKSILILLFLYIFVSTMINGVCYSKTEDPVKKLADSVLDKIGGEKAWNKTRYIRFDHVLIQDGKEISRFCHLWDKTTGNYRLEWSESPETSVIAFINLVNKVGSVYLNGKLVSEAESTPYIDVVYEKFLEQSYCLYLPFKLLADENTISMQPQESSDPEKHDILQLKIGQKELIPVGEYNFYVNPKTGLIDRCKYKFQDGSEGDYFWKNWEKSGKLRLSSIRESADGKTIIKFENLKVFDFMTPQVFENINIRLP
jgi:hypothetical protein